MCLLRSSVTHLCHWMISCTLSHTRIVFQRSVRLSVCQQSCDVFQCMQDRQMCVCLSLCMSPCMILYVTVCPTVYITMFHYMCCRMSPCIMSLCVCHTQVKNVYVQFLMHAYIDTDVELREVYSRDTMWELFENFLPDISTVSAVLKLC